MKKDRVNRLLFGARVRILAWIFTVIMIVLALVSAGQSSGFADHLFDEGDYPRALGEYHRLAFFASDPGSTCYFQFKIGECHRLLRNYERAKEHFDRILITGKGWKELENKAIMSSAMCLINRNDTQYARIILEDLRSQGYGGDSLSFLMGMSYLKDRRFVEAEVEFEKIRSGEIHQSAMKSLDDISSRKFKSPRTALLLSACIPGAGQVYASRPVKGLISFSLNLSLGYLTYRAYKDNRKLDSFLVLYFGLQRFYFGNLHQARQYTAEYNNRVTESVTVE